MTTSAADRWADWLMRGRSAGMDAVARERMQRELTGTRDRVLDGADLQPGDVVLDAGCGTGLLTFGALDRIGEAGRVIGVDVSPPNPLWPPTIDLVREALGPQTDAYLAFMVAGIDRGGYRFACPAAFLTGVR